MAAILRNLEHLGPNFALHSAKLRGLGPEQRSLYTFWILMRLQTNQKHIGPALHVEPNDIECQKDHNRERQSDSNKGFGF